MNFKKLSFMFGLFCMMSAAFIAALAFIIEIDINLAYLGLFLLIAGDILAESNKPKNSEEVKL
jgi:hypothetical protein